MAVFQDKDLIRVKTGRFPPAADYTIAQANPDNLTDTIPLYDCREIDCFIDIRNPGTATEMHVRFRFSGEEAPVIGNTGDWGYLMVDNIDPLTGLSTVQDYEVVFTPISRRFLLRITQTSGTWVSCVIWVDQGATTDGNVWFVRQGGT